MYVVNDVNTSQSLFLVDVRLHFKCRLNRLFYTQKMFHNVDKINNVELIKDVIKISTKYIAKSLMSKLFEFIDAPAEIRVNLTLHIL